MDHLGQVQGRSLPDDLFQTTGRYPRPLPAGGFSHNLPGFLASGCFYDYIVSNMQLVKALWVKVVYLGRRFKPDSNYQWQAIPFQGA